MLDRLLNRISIDPEVCFGKPCIRGHRIWVSVIAERLNTGSTIDDVLADYPQLERDDVLACGVYDLRCLHRHSIRNRAEIAASDVCGCFFCRRIFRPTEAIQWTDVDKSRPRGPDNPGQTAMCPHCGIDSVIGSASGRTISRGRLAAMNAMWFRANAESKRLNAERGRTTDRESGA